MAIIKVTREMAEARLGEVPPEKSFWCRDGRILTNLAQLEAALREMDDDTFRYHASGDKNDFSKWVREVVGDDKLSHDVEKSRDRLEAAKHIADRISWLDSKITGR